ncbi:helix-turn-helix domain-containing protein [Caldimonas brevitalea]|uniref:Transcriptional regulator, AraC family n=1 Tax=Caldimonas brevitalea TaxID=413882 RepID=A0A0G3BNF6_9BURK|nr:AraC family transcriptional regulator [Caldimonas brevitalea]AKJ28080.1 transcriptional regulator, AraC family [Caldimonas brevitalea]
MHVRQPSYRLPTPRPELELVEQPELSSAFMLSGAHRADVPQGWSYPRHDHPYFELCLLLEGEQQVRLTGNTLTQGPGDLLLLTPFEAHAASTDVASRFYCLHFDVDDIDLRRLLCLAGTRVWCAHEPAMQEVRPWLDRMAALQVGPADSALRWRLAMGAALTGLFAALAVACEARVEQAPALPQAALQTAASLAALIEREVDQGAQETPLEAAIRRLGYAPDYGNALFKQVYGMSAQHYRSSLKLRRAKLLLLNTQLSVAQVSEQLGYANGAHFSRQFKRWSGMSPQAFRRTQNVAA